MLKVNFAQPVIGLDGIQVKNPKDEAVLLSTLLANSLVTMRADKDAARVLHIAEKLFLSEGEEEYEDADIELIKRSIPTVQLNVLVGGRISALIEGAELEKRAKK